jgi:hypothetical protein
MRQRRRFSNKDKLSVVLGLLLGGFVAILAVGLMSKYNAPPVKIKPSIASSYLASCKIDTLRGTGTGVLLDTGFVLTAGHNIDSNRDGIITKKERKVVLKFSTEYGNTYQCTGHVIYVGNIFKDDFAIVEPDIHIWSDVKFKLRRAILGQDLYTIGCSKGKALHITTGVESTSVRDPLGRTSIDAYGGNSGGGVFDKNQNVLGVMTRIGVDIRSGRATTVIPINTPRGFRLHIARGNVRYVHMMAGWSEYVRSETIYHTLAEKKLGFTVIPDKEPINYRVITPYIKMSAQIFFFLFGVLLFRKELFRN